MDDRQARSSKMRFSLVGALAALAGCVCSTSPKPAATTAATTEPTTSSAATQPSSNDKPFLVREAAMPVGFPPPGPIGKVVVKTYPAFRLAKVSATDLSGAGQNSMFQVLFNHIQKEDIKMTAPVVMGFDRAGNSPKTHPTAHPPTSMGFAYQSTNVGKLETDGQVRVEDEPSVTVISVGVRGSYDAEHFNTGMKAIDDFLAQHPGEYEPIGSPRFLGYNSPFVPWFMRYGEVQLPVRKLK